MVQSRVNPNLHYPESEEMDPEDEGYSAMTCELAGEKEGTFMLVAFGKIKYVYHDKGVLFYPLYLITNGMQIKAKIGLVEVPVKHAIRILDENKEIRLELLEDPLLFAFANEEYLEHFSVKELPVMNAAAAATAAATTEAIDDDDDASESVRHARELLAPGLFQKAKRVIPPPPVPEETETEAQPTETHPADKDARFWVQRFFNNERYGVHAVVGNDSFLQCLCEAFQQMGRETTVAKLRALLALEATKSEFTSRREAFVKSDARLQSEIASGDSFQDITSLQHFREYILTTRFRPDNLWAMSILEKKLHTKFIILLEAEFDGGDEHHVIWCFPTSSVKNPENYILLSSSSGQYSLVTYKNKADHDVGKRIFTFPELPWGVKQLIAQRCAEKSAAGFEGIPAFQDLASQRGYDDSNAQSEEEVGNKKVVFQFHRTAKSKAGPGQGPNERIPVHLMETYQPLRRIKQWRQKLDDAWAQSKFHLDGKTWSSVVHYVQSNKFRKSNPEYADTFALDTNTALSKNVDLALMATQKKNAIAAGKVGDEVRANALVAKFGQNADLKQVLLLTKPATLLHYRPKHVTGKDAALMELRDALG